MAQYGREHKKRHAIEKYKRKVSAEATGYMYPRFDPNLNLSIPSFAFNLQINLNIDIDFSIITSGIIKAKYGHARYNVDVYDPIAPIGVLIPNELTKQLYIYMTNRFTYATYRGYKYSLKMAKQFLDADLPIFTDFAPSPVWMPRFKKIEAWRNWTSFFNLAFFNVNIFPAKNVFIRVTDSPTFYGYSINPRTVLNDNLSSNLYDHGVYDNSFYLGDQDPYSEVILLSPNIYCYEPIWNVANFNYDRFIDKPVFDPSVLINIVEQFKGTQQPAYRSLVWLKGAERMQTMYMVHATYQHDILAKILRRFSNVINSPIEMAQYQAFALEYAYERKFMRLVEAEKVVLKYISLGLSETVLRGIIKLTSRK